MGLTLATIPAAIQSNLPGLAMLLADDRSRFWCVPQATQV